MTFDEQLRRACAQSADVLGSAAPEEGADHAFSHGFDRRARGLGFRAEHPYARAALHRAAMLFLALILSTGTFLAADAEARAAFFGWVKSERDNSIVYGFTEDSRAALPEYALSWLPDGFTEHDRFSNDRMSSTLYTNEAGNTIVFDYSLQSEGMEVIYLFGGKAPYEQINLDGISYDFYSADGFSQTNNLIWLDEELGIVFMLDSSLPQDVMLHIAESIYLVNSPN